MDFSYEVKNGLSEVQSASGILYVVKRSLDTTAVGNFAYNTYVRSAKNDDYSILSIVYRPHQLGRLRQWHDIHKANPNVLVKKLYDVVSSPYGRSPEDASQLMNKLGLCAAAGLFHNFTDVSKNRFIELLPSYEDVVMQQDHLHSAALGVVAAHAARQQLTRS